jgi:hypothetical protein
MKSNPEIEKKGTPDSPETDQRAIQPQKHNPNTTAPRYEAAKKQKRGNNQQTTKSHGARDKHMSDLKGLTMYSGTARRNDENHEERQEKTTTM